MKRVKSRRRRILRTASICIALTCLTVAGIAWYAQSIQQEINTREAARLTNIEAVERQLEEIKTRKAAEERARKEAANEAADKAAEGDASAEAKNCSATADHATPSRIDVVVNKKHCIQPLTYSPTDLVNTNGATLSAKASADFNRLFTAAAGDGMPFYVTSSYRSYQTQVSTYAYWVSLSGADGADTYSARPGYSEHQTGLAVDVAAHGCVLDCFGSTAQYTWLQKNAAKYGFIQRYYKGYEAITGYSAEEWHYRYVGPEVALDMKKQDIKTLEEYWGVPGGDYYYDLKE